MRMVVVLPDPLAPRNPKIWPRGASNERLSRAATDPKCLVRFAMTRDMSRKPTHEPIAPARGRSGQERVRPRPPPPERLGTASSQLLEVRLPRVVPVPELFGFAAPALLGFAVLD